MAKHLDDLQKAYNEVAFDDLDLKEQVAHLKLMVDLLTAAVMHPKKAKPRKRAR